MIRKCPKCGIEKESYLGKWCKECHQEYYKLHMREHRKNNPDKTHANSKKWYEKQRSQVFEHYGNKCAECGCPEITFKLPNSKKEQRILELNHLHGGGQLDLNSNVQKYYQLVVGERKWEDYNLLCKVCNTAHYVREIAGIKGHKVIWKE